MSAESWLPSRARRDTRNAPERSSACENAGLSDREPRSSCFPHSIEGSVLPYRKRGRNPDLASPRFRHAYVAFRLRPARRLAGWKEFVMRQDRTIRRGVRANALWGRRGESRSNALWGSGKRGMITLALAAMLVVPVAGSASSGGSGSGSDSAIVPASLLAQAAANPLQNFDVIVQGDKKSSSADVAEEVRHENG